MLIRAHGGEHALFRDGLELEMEMEGAAHTSSYEPGEKKEIRSRGNEKAYEREADREA